MGNSISFYPLKAPPWILHIFIYCKSGLIHMKFLHFKGSLSIPKQLFLDLSKKIISILFSFRKKYINIDAHVH